MASRSSGETVWLRVGRLFDPESGSTIADAHIVFDGTTLLHVSPEPPDPAIVSGATTKDLSGVVALPPMVDAHTHVSLCGSELDAAKRAEALARPAGDILAEALERARTLRSLGVLGMRDGGDKDGVGLRISKESRNGAGNCGMATVFSPGAGIHRKGRYGSFFSQPVEDFDSPEDCVVARVGKGADHIKIVPTGIINFKKGAVTAPPQFSSGEITRLTTAAAAHGRQTMAHASGSDGIENAICGGVDTIEHGYFITREQIGRLRDQTITWVPTFAPVHRQIVHADRMGWDQAVLDHLRRILDGHRESLTYALSIGVRVLAGSDAGSYGVPHGHGLLEEMLLLEESGMSVTAVLQAACRENLRRLRPDASPWLLQSGQSPTFILAPVETLKSVRFFRDPVVLIGGELIPPLSQAQQRLL